MSQPHDPLSAFHLGDISVSESGVRASQRLCARFADHRGVIELPALAVLFDHCGGIPFHRIHDDPAAATLSAQVVAKAVVLGPGDGLYMPRKWWHFCAAVDGPTMEEAASPGRTEPAMGINFWWPHPR